MMWNWQLSALASGSEIVLYDGPLTGPGTLWQVVSAERVSVFGTGPTYLQLCEDSGFSPRREDMPDLRAILSTGSVLHDWQYDWVRDKVGPVPLQSISGGTDIIGCFVLGNPNLPVHRGRIQCRSLGLDVQALPAAGEPSSSAVGELVCRNPFPSRPLGLLGDDGRRFHDAYFKRNPGVWTHGDLVEFDHDGQARIHGRSDGVLKVQGVRVGPAEIYGALRDVLEVGEAMVVEQQAPELHGRSRLVLLAVVNEPATLDGRLKVRIRREIARQASPLHVPELLVQVEELPTTHSGKQSERAARDAVNGLPAGNAEALRNPDSLDRIRLSVARAAEELSELAGAAEPAPGASTEARLRAIWESVLGVAPLRPDDNFFDVGGTSLAAVRLFQLIHDRMEIDLPLSTVIHAQTPASMAALIDGPPEERVPSLVLLRPGEGDRPLFLMHSINGDVLEMRELALQLSADRPVYGLQARGLDPHEQPQTRVEEMAETYIAILRSVQPTGPYALGGYSFGGLVAFETARRLTARGEAVDWLGLIDTEVHHDCLPALLRWRFLFARSLRFLRAALAAPRDRPVPLPEWEGLPPLERHLGRVGWKAFGAYRPGPYAGSAALFLSELRRPEMCDPVPVWTRCVKGGLAIQRVPGGHFDVIKEPNLGVLSEQVSASLARSLEPGVASPPPQRS
jgi:acetoacetyl-CoA synthetase